MTPDAIRRCRWCYHSHHVMRDGEGFIACALGLSMMQPCPRYLREPGIDDDREGEA